MQKLWRCTGDGAISSHTRVPEPGWNIAMRVSALINFLVCGQSDMDVDNILVSHDNNKNKIEVNRIWHHTLRNEGELVQTSEVWSPTLCIPQYNTLLTYTQAKFFWSYCNSVPQCTSIGISLWVGTCRLRHGVPLCVWLWGSESWVYYKHIKCPSQIDSRSDLVGFCLCCLAICALRITQRPCIYRDRTQGWAAARDESEHVLRQKAL